MSQTATNPAPVTTSDAERAAFEAWATRKFGQPPLTWLEAEGGPYSVPPGVQDHYYVRSTQTAWEAWQAARSTLPGHLKQATDQGGRYPEGFDASCGIPAKFMCAANMTCASLTGNRTWDVKCVAAALQFAAQDAQSQAAPTLLGVADGDAA